MPKKSSKKIWDPQNVYIGLDVHLRQWNVCIYQGGIRRKTFQQKPEVEVLLSHLLCFYPEMKYFSAYEAGICGCSLHYSLIAAGIENIIFNPADVAQTHKERVRKTDSMDASKIARSLAQGDLKCIHIPPLWRLDDRNMLRLRSSLVLDMRRRKPRIRHFCHSNGIRIPEKFGPRHWPKDFLLWLRESAAPKGSVTAETLGRMADEYENALRELKEVNKRLREMMASERYCADFGLLRTIPGVGELTAATILLECGDLTDFSSAEAFCAFVGLIPDMDRSDQHDGYCGMTHRRHKILRYMLTECAWRAVHEDDHLSKLYSGYTKRMPSAKAIVRIAHKLAKIIKFVLKNKKAYEPQSQKT